MAAKKSKSKKNKAPKHRFERTVPVTESEPEFQGINEALDPASDEIEVDSADNELSADD